MDLRLLLRQIAVKHGTEDGASHGQHILGGREVGRGGAGRCVREHMQPESLVFAKFNKTAGVAQFSFRVSDRVLFLPER